MHELKTKLEHVGRIWVEELSNILWSFRTTPCRATREMSFDMVYGPEAVLPTEIGVETIQIFATAWVKELNLVEERRMRTFYRMERYRTQISHAYNKWVVPRSFQMGDLMLRRVYLEGSRASSDLSEKCLFMWYPTRVQGLII